MSTEILFSGEGLTKYVSVASLSNNSFSLHTPCVSNSTHLSGHRGNWRNSGVLSVCCNDMIIALMPLIRSYLGDLHKYFTFRGFNKNVHFNCSELLHQDFMEMVYGFIFQSLPVDTWVINVYALEFVFNKSHIFDRGRTLRADKFIYTFQRDP